MELLVLLWFLSILVNIFWSILDLPTINIKTFKSKKWKDKVDPIFKLETNELYYNEVYSVFRYDLGWTQADSGWAFVIPLYQLFGVKGYIRDDDSYGSFNKKEVREKPTSELLYPYDNVRDYWLGEDEKLNAEIKVRKDRENKFSNKLGEINKEFLENYE